MGETISKKREVKTMEAKFKIFDVTHRQGKKGSLEDEVNDYLASIPGQIVDVKMSLMVDPSSEPYRAYVELFLIVLHHPD